MKPEYRKTLLKPNESFSIAERHIDYFDIPWHLHSEFELIYVCRSEGKKYIGDFIGDFKQGDLVLMGPNLPHCWLNDKIENCKGEFFDTRYKVIHFDIDCFGSDFFSIPELYSIKRMLNKASRGIQISGEIVYKVSYMMYEMLSQDPVDKFLSLLQILKDLSKWKEIDYLSSSGFSDLLTHSEDRTMNIIEQYLLENFKTELKLAEIANRVNLSVSSFCRYFKKKTDKTFFQYATEFKIGYACNLIQNTDINISEVGYESGFENLSHFYKKFKTIKGKTPKMYQAELKKQNF